MRRDVVAKTYTREHWSEGERERENKLAGTNENDEYVSCSISMNFDGSNVSYQVKSCRAMRPDTSEVQKIHTYTVNVQVTNG